MHPVIESSFFILFSWSGELTLPGCEVPIKLLSHSPSSAEQVEKTRLKDKKTVS